MKTTIWAYASALVGMLVLDGIWLAVQARRFYAPRLGNLMADTPQWLPVILFYLIYALALTVLVLLPAAQHASSLLKVFGQGALLGLAAYGTYNLTNQAILRNWPVQVTVVDLIWGTLLTGTVALVASLVVRRVG